MFHANITYENDQIEQVIYGSLDEAREDLRYKSIEVEHGCDCDCCEREESYDVKSVIMFVDSIVQPIEFRWKNCPFPPGDFKRERKHGEEWIEDFGGISSGGSEPLEFRYFINGEPLENIVAGYKKKDKIWWDDQTIPWSGF